MDLESSPTPPRKTKKKRLVSSRSRTVSPPPRKIKKKKLSSQVTRSRTPSPPRKRKARSPTPPPRKRRARSPTPSLRSRSPSPSPSPSPRRSPRLQKQRWPTRDEFLRQFPQRGAFLWTICQAFQGAGAPPGRATGTPRGEAPRGVHCTVHWLEWAKVFALTSFLREHGMLKFFYVSNSQLIEEIKADKGLSFDPAEVVQGKNPKSVMAALRQATTNARMQLKIAIQV